MHKYALNMREYALNMHEYALNMHIMYLEKATISEKQWDPQLNRILLQLTRDSGRSILLFSAQACPPCDPLVYL